MLSATDANNKKIVFKGRPVRERTVDAPALKSLTKRGLISKRQVRRLRKHKGS